MSHPFTPLVGTIIRQPVKHITEFGVFLAMDEHEDLLIPERHLQQAVNIGDMIYVYVFYEDNTDRILGSTKLSHYLPEQDKTGQFTQGQSVVLHIFAASDLGYKVIVDGTHLGLLFKVDALCSRRIGDKYHGFIKQVREDGKIDVCLQLHTPDARKSLEEQILDALESHNGLLTITDKSSPEEIQHAFHVSKGSYKKAIGALYKQKKIILNPEFIKLV